MALLKKQADSLSGGFYLLEEPTLQAKRYLVGGISRKSLKNSTSFGRFKAYDLKEVVELEEPAFVFSKEELEAFLRIESKEKAFSELSLKLEEKKTYFDVFSSVTKLMESSDLKKAVLYARAVSKQGFVSLEEFCALAKNGLANKDSGYLFGFYDPVCEKALLGCSPEYIYKTGDDKSLITTAVAGTKLKSSVEEKGWSKKLLKEHELVMKGVSESLDEQVEWGEVYNFEYGDLCHLRAEGVIFSNISPKLIGEKLHPTPAVGCLPKNFPVDSLGPENRGYFGGYVELSSYKRPFSLVTIRCFEWSDEKLQVCIGGGVLQESIFEEEWLELENKLKTFKDLWGISD